MTQEEKGKAYDKVREKIAVRFGTNVAKEIFSEFEESEDERIRKALIEYFNEQCDMSDWNGVYGYQVVSWLEKQGQKLAWSEEDVAMLDSTIAFVEHSAFTTIGKGKNNVIAWLKNLKDRVLPQPKQEWSKGDEERIKNILSVLNVQVCWNGATGKKENPYQKEINWLKSLKDRAQPQQKQEWSEEDDYNLQCMIAKVASDIQKGNVGRNNELIDWLKSFKYRLGG